MVPTPQGCRIAKRAGKQFLTARVKHCYSNLKSLETGLFFQKCQLKFTQKLATLESYKGESQTRTSSKTKERHKRKFGNLLARQSHPQSRVSHWVVNLSAKHLDASHISVLGRGLNFAPALTRVPTDHLCGVSENVAVKARMSVIRAASRARMPPKNVPPREL